jgi:uncharacterized protein YjdB
LKAYSKWLVMLLSLLLFTAAIPAQSKAVQEGAAVEWIKVLPAHIYLQLGQAKNIQVLVKYTNGPAKKVDDAQIVSLNEKVAAVSGNRVTGVAEGTAEIQAAYGGVTASAVVHVRDHGRSDDKHRSEYGFSITAPDTVGVGEYVKVPVTLQSVKAKKLGYEGVKIAVEKSDGPGDVLFRAADTAGKVQSWLNSGTWGEPGFDLAPDYSSTTEWTWKFSKIGVYTIVYKLLDSEGRIIAAEEAVVEAQPAIQDLGTQISNLTIMRGTFGKENGRDKGYTVVVGNPGKLAVVDVKTETVEKLIDLPGATGSWSTVVASDGTVYTGTYPNGRIYKYVPGGSTVEDLGQPVPNQTVIYGLTAGKEGKIYGGTYYNGCLFEYDPAKGFTNFGEMVPGQQYVRSVAYDPEREVLYAGVGAKAYLIKYDLKTGQKENVLPAGFDNATFVSDMVYIKGKLFAKIDPGTQTVVIDTATWTIDAQFTAPSVYMSPLSPSGDTVYYTNGPYLYEYNLNTKTYGQVLIGGNPINLGQTIVGSGFVEGSGGDFTGTTLYGFIGNYQGSTFEFNPENKAFRISSVPLPPQPTDIFNLGTDLAGNIMSNGYISGGVAFYNPHNGTSVQYSGVGQAESIYTFAGKIYFGVYPGAVIYEYDPAKPWQKNVNPKKLFDLKADEQNRPVAMAGSSEDGKLFIGSIPDYGKYGGAMTIYDPATQAVRVERNIVANQSVISLVYKDGKVFGGTRILNGDGTDPIESEAKLFVWDVKTGQKTAEFVPVPGAASVGGLTVGPDGNIWGSAQGKLFILNPQTNEIIEQHNIVDSNNALALLVARDGTVYGTVDGQLLRIDPATKQATVLREANSFRLAEDGFGNIYFKDGPAAAYGYKLGRYTLEDPRVSVTGITLDQTQVKLSAGQTAYLKASVEPVFASNQTVRWQSSNSGVASVSADGVIRAVAPGTATVTVKTQDGGFQAVCQVEVAAAAM